MIRLHVLFAAALMASAAPSHAQFYSSSTGSTATSTATASNSWGSGSATAAATGTAEARATNANGYCDDQVAQEQATARAKDISDRTLLARELYSDMPNGGFFEAGCLSNLLNSGINILFQPPNFAALRDRLINAACSRAQSYVAQGRQMLIQRATSMISGSTGQLPLGNIIPGVNLGSLGAGVSFQPAGSGGLSTNVGDVFARANGGFGVQDYLNGRSGGSSTTRVGNGFFSGSGY